MTSSFGKSVLGSTEVPAKASRRQFAPSYKAQVLAEVDRCNVPGEIGALLRREGLYSSHLTAWRQAREKGTLEALSKKRGPVKAPSEPTKEMKRLQRENERLRKQLRQAEAIIEVQKKVSEILGIDLNRPESDEND